MSFKQNPLIEASGIWFSKTNKGKTFWCIESNEDGLKPISLPIGFNFDNAKVLTIEKVLK